MDLSTLTAKKVAGIPVLYLVLGIAVIALYGSLKLKPTATADDADETGDDVSSDEVDTDQPVFLATPTITQPSGVNTGSVTAVSGPDTDDLWKRRAIDWLRQNGYTLDVATAAINKYLEGQMLSTVEAQARDAAVRQFGLPPESIPTTTTETPDPPDTGSPEPPDLPTTPNYNGPASKQGSPPTNHTVRGTSDDSFPELALLYYKRADHTDTNLIQSYNTAISRPFPPGTVVKIPAMVEPKFYTATSATRTANAIAQKNGTTATRVRDLNLGKNFPVSAGTRVRVR